MPIRGTIRVDGLRALGENIRLLQQEMGLRIARSATNAGAQVIKQRAVRKVETNPSIDTGSLHDAVVVKRASRGETGALTSLHVVAVRQRKSGSTKARVKQHTAPYAHLVEFGTRKMQAEPFMRPAFDEGKGDALDAMVGKIESGTARAVAKLKS